jgi:hypothetical protein
MRDSNSSWWPQISHQAIPPPIHHVKQNKKRKAEQVSNDMNKYVNNPKFKYLFPKHKTP